MRRTSPTTHLLADLLRRVGQLLIVVAVVTVLTFAFVHLIPGDPAVTILGVRATPESLAALRAQLGVDRPLGEQFLAFIGALAHGDLGTSIAMSRPVVSLIGPALGVTFGLVSIVVVFSTIVGIAAGLVAALSGSRVVDRLVRIGGIVLLAVPSFLLGLLLISLLAVRLGLLPAGGWTGFQSVVLPTLALAGIQAPLIARAVRASALETMTMPFVLAATSRGIGRRRVVFNYVLPNSLLSVITIIGFSIAGLMGGSAVIEAVFAIPGIGSLLVNAVTARDYPVIQGVTLVTAVLVVVISFLTEVIYVLVDPRTRRATR